MDNYGGGQPEKRKERGLSFLFSDVQALGWRIRREDTAQWRCLMLLGTQTDGLEGCLKGVTAAWISPWLEVTIGPKMIPGMHNDDLACRIGDITMTRLRQLWEFLIIVLIMHDACWITFGGAQVHGINRQLS